MVDLFFLNIGFCSIVDILMQLGGYFGEFHDIFVLCVIDLLSVDVGNRVFWGGVSWMKRNSVVFSLQMYCYGFFHDIE